MKESDIMKRIFGILICVIMLTACTNKPVSNNQTMENASPANVEQTEKKLKRIDKSDKAVDTNGMTVLGEAMINIDGGIQDVYLMTSAQMGNDGYMLWDDSQRWVLAAGDESSSYTLFDSNIHGKAYIDVSESESGTVISLIRIQTVGMTVTKYTYKDGAFYPEDVLTAEPGGNNIYTSIPDYIKY